MEDLGQNLSSPLLTELLKTRDGATKQLSELNMKLAETKPLKRGGVKQAIRNVEQEIKRIDRSIDKERNDLIRLENKKTQQILAEQGIDSRAGLMEGIAGIAGEGAKIAGAIVGKGGVSAVGVERAKRDASIGVAEQQTEQQKVKSAGLLGMSTNMLMIVGGVLVVLFMLMKKK
jgi:hypothetical protein